VAIPEGVRAALVAFAFAGDHLQFGRAGAGGPVVLRLEQAVQVDHDIFHFRVVDRALGLAAPGVFGSRVAVVNADEVDAVEIDEVEAASRIRAASEHEVKLAHPPGPSSCRSVSEP
jgi:hypothetical protein